MSISPLSIQPEVITLKSGATAVCLKCAGTYRVGSSGKPEARAIYEAACSSLEQASADALLLDYTELHYEWGDDMWLTFQVDHPSNDQELPFAVVVGDSCKDAIKSLLESDGGYDDWLHSGYVFFSKSIALAYLSDETSNA